MKLSTKGRYAVTALADIALQGESGPVSLADIAERQDISVAYLEQLFGKLRRAGVVESLRGPGGGYSLMHPANQTRISDVMAAVDEKLNAMANSGACGTEKVGQGCAGSKASCLTHNLWEQLSAHVYVFLNQTTIADVIEDRMIPCPAVPSFIGVVDEEMPHG